jgi:GTP-binding protein
LAQRTSLRGLFVIVDSRRGVSESDLGLLEWAAAAGRPTHILLSKADKLKKSELQKTLKDSVATLAGRASLQAFSAVDKLGLEEARAQLDHWLVGFEPTKKLPR